MRRARLLAALAGIITVLLLQATLVGPATNPYPISLPLVVVAAVALVDGPAAGMSFGFAAGLVADLASRHPAGVLALCWLGVGLLCGLVADRRTVRRDAVVIAIVGGLASSVATVLLVITRDGPALSAAITQLPFAALGDLVLAFAVVPVVRGMLRTASLRAARPVLTELAIGGRRG